MRIEGVNCGCDRRPRTGTCPCRARLPTTALCSRRVAESCPRLLAAHGVHRIDSSRTASWDVGGEQRDADQDDGHGREGRRVGRPAGSPAGRHDDRVVAAAGVLILATVRQPVVRTVKVKWG